MPQALVLGAGMVGSVMAADLAADRDIEVAIADMRPEALKRAETRCGGHVRTISADLADAAEVKRLVQPYDIVLGALASRIGFQTLRAVIEAGKNYCDISFFEENALELDDLAKANGVTAVVDCGVAPGMSHMLAGYGFAQLDECTSIEIYVGGLPRERRWPFQYKAAFSPADVIEEYTRPARLVEHGQIVERPALSEPELIDFAGIGTLEAFNTDGLRSLLYTMKVPSMKEKTLRYPGHIELMRVFRETGLFSREALRIGEASIRPLDLTSALMFPMWAYQNGEEDLTVMRVVVEGLKSGLRRRYIWDLLDYYDRAGRTTSMARTTAFPCCIIAKLMAAGEFRSTPGEPGEPGAPGAMPGTMKRAGARAGVVTPELIGSEPGMLDRVLTEHERRGVHYRAKVEAA